MTYIPGTGTLKPVTNSKNSELKIPPQVFTSVNVRELKVPKEEKEELLEPEQWYHELKYWMIIGSTPAIVFGLLSIVNWRFLLTLPLFPYLAYITWHVRKWMRKNSKKFDTLSH